MKLWSILVLVLCSGCYNVRPAKMPLKDKQNKPSLIAPPPLYGNKIV